MKSKSNADIMTNAQLIERINQLIKQYQGIPKYNSSGREENKRKQNLGETRSLCKRLIRNLDILEVLDRTHDKIVRRIAETVTAYFRSRKLGDLRYLSVSSLKNILNRYIDQKGILSSNSLRKICFPTKSAPEFLISQVTTRIDFEAGHILQVLQKVQQFMGINTPEQIRQSMGGNRYSDDFLTDIRKMFPREKITELVAVNPYYAEIYKKLYESEQRIAEINRGLLAAIPDTYPELFPLAREMQRHFVLHIGPTNSGKSYEALEALKEADTGIYLAPLRLLAYEKYEELNEAGVYCSLKTGEEEITVPGATIRSSTIEILDFTKLYDVAVIDEAQMVADPQRGSAWTMALLGVCAETIHVCLAPEAQQVVLDIISACEDTYEIHRHERLVPLLTREYPEPVFPSNSHRGDAFIVFSRRDVHAAASELQRNGVKCSVIYGNLPYDVRREEVKRYINGDTDVVVATDAIGMGLNLPIKRIIFLSLTKFDGIQQRYLHSSEIKQIAGRAGRYGIFSEGIVTSDTEFDYLESAVHDRIPSIHRARIGFPYSLIGIDGLVSELMNQWGHIKPKPGFEVADMARETELARILEKDTDNKELVYRFVMFPFDEKDDTLMMIWYDLFQAELTERDDYLKWLPVSPNEREEGLKELEQAFKICDILYHYADAFTDRLEIPGILRRKSEISQAIMKILAKENLETRTCKYCGRVMPFYYPHGVCPQCRKTMNQQRSRRPASHRRRH